MVTSTRFTYMGAVFPSRLYTNNSRSNRGATVNRSTWSCTPIAGGVGCAKATRLCEVVSASSRVSIESPPRDAPPAIHRRMYSTSPTASGVLPSGMSVP